MRKYQVVVLRSLKGFGQFVTESRDEVNTYEFGEDDERPIIFGEKLKAVERRTVMRKVREVLGVKCWLTTAKKGAEAGISGLCMSCPACVLFGGTYAPKRGGGGGGQKNAIEMRRAFYTGAFPFLGGGIRDVTFNAVDERTGQTGRALGTNQLIEPRDFVDVVTVEANAEEWVKLLVWGIEHSDRYGANARIYGEVHNAIVGVIEDTRLRVAAIDLARLEGLDGRQTVSVEEMQRHCTQRGLTLRSIVCPDVEVDALIRDLARSPEVEDLSGRRNRVDLGVDEYFEAVAKKYGGAELRKDLNKKKDGAKPTWKAWRLDERRRRLEPADLDLSAVLSVAGARADGKVPKEEQKGFVMTEYRLARLIESALGDEGEDDGEGPAG